MKKTNIDTLDEQRLKELKKLQRLHVSTSNLLIAIKSLAALLKASIPLSDTVKTISEQSSDPNLNKIFKYISEEIEKGSTMAEAMTLFPKVFPGTLSSVVEAGEKGGSLEDNLLFIAESIKKEWELSKKMKGAIIYPTIIMSLTMVEFIGMIFIILPKMESLFSSFPNIPPLTMFIMNTALAIRTNWITVLAIILSIVIAISIFLKTKTGYMFKGWLALNFPILKKLFTSNILSSFSRTLSVLLASGIPISKALQITSTTMSNFIYAKTLNLVYESVQDGKDLSLSLAEYPKYFNKSFVKMIDVGEVSGTLEENLMYLHEYYSDEVTEMSNNIVTFVEPLLLILVGAIIGVLGVTILMPIYQLMGSING
ncbi:MAG: type II secretion system protein, type IV pilus assembly protein PilC [candidate division WS6 bacterium GW2011_GWE2_33_157]|uniref:Type II secretion system protein n=1 Tax=candidate division WS6 bacterium GW2011_GWB1_33_6 TaxID=1619088 RepID=A0A0G0CWA9_9BACT|nr:MAG: type II secretion system protein, type IV pilus assembly protein PilC [candidate division WS6 bacterium GW2011_GWE2_33_157]KKP45884.1 MAG: type II secretion system protein, type IV pilus assembly protein PilC [candidate division WS6 bacterium GW2011_GWF1_33_233]KKP55119.1 MAG: type II secretion system protein, type IV pilus assembly protein PilC [candidate division WS6 bacterium GW2011_WS6_33_547]KKP55345.1 MAG: Type II secretion system protein [candidate division WS6 bacterium GW2011_GW